jgi:hypothetical protein
VADYLKPTWWFWRASVHEACRGRGAARLFTAAQAVIWVPLSPVLTVARTLWVLCRTRRTRYYVSPEGDAVLGVTVRSDGWHIADHISARPGSGQGRALRDLVRGPLLAEADRQGVTIHVTAANKKLAARYAQELPGLVDVGQAFPRGRWLRRLPNTR